MQVKTTSSQIIELSNFYITVRFFQDGKDAKTLLFNGKIFIEDINSVKTIAEMKTFISTLIFGPPVGPDPYDRVLHKNAVVITHITTGKTATISNSLFRRLQEPGELLKLVNKILAEMKASKEFIITHEDLVQPVEEITCQNGNLNLRTLKLTSHTPVNSRIITPLPPALFSCA